MTDRISLNQLRTNSDYDLVSLYEDNVDEEEADSLYAHGSNNNEYYEPEQFNTKFGESHDSFSYFQLNCRGLSSNWDAFHDLICDLHGTNFSFDFIGISELFQCDKDPRISLSGYHNIITRCRMNSPRGGVGLFIKDNITYTVREDISLFIPHVLESLFIETTLPSGKHSIIGLIYRPNTEPLADLDIFSTSLFGILDIINNERKQCIIMGDMNINLLKFDTHSKTNDYLNNIFSHGFMPVITKPTRVTSVTASLIDHIYTNNIIHPGSSGIIINDVADHFGTFHISTNKRNVKLKNINKSRCFSEHNIHTFKDILEKTNFEHINQINDANAAYKEFMILYHEAFDKAFPLRNVTYKNKRIKREPWITTGIIKSSKTKSKLLAKKLKQPTDENIQTYKQYNNILTKTKKAMKKAYFQNALNENKYNIKKVWSILKIAISKQNNKSSFPLTFMINDAPISDRSHICESFNDYFSSIGIQTSKNVPKSDKSFSSYMPNQSRNSMYLEPIEPQTVLEATNKLKTKLSSGHDNISTKLIKETINQTLEPLTYNK